MRFELIGSSNLNNEIKSNVRVNTKSRLLSYIKIIALDLALLHCLADSTASHTIQSMQASPHCHPAKIYYRRAFDLWALQDYPLHAC